jgi:hypothetical protein
MNDFKKNIILNDFKYLGEFRQAEFPPVGGLGWGNRLELLVHPDVPGVLDGQVEAVSFVLGALNVDGAVDANSGVDIGQFGNAGEETAAVAVDVLLASLPVPFAVAT